MQYISFRPVILAFAALFLVSAAAARDDDNGVRRPGHDVGQFQAIKAIREVALADLKFVEPAAGPTVRRASVQSKAEVKVLSSLPKIDLGTFHSVAISAGKLPSAYKWRAATDRDYAALFSDNCKASGLSACNSHLATVLRKVRAEVVGRDTAEVLTIVNNAVNDSFRYVADRAAWGQGDYWANPVETATKGMGDCEDYAIVKLWLLRSLGYEPSQLQLVVLQDTRKLVYHAVLAVHVNGTRYVLDSLANRAASDTAFSSYLPIMSFVGAKSYIHGFKGRRSDIAAMPADLDAVSPGEGV